MGGGRNTLSLFLRISFLDGSFPYSLKSLCSSSLKDCELWEMRDFRKVQSFVRQMGLE